ncbi:MAG TPA: SUMF1/EgtB/PvdO family nonheme iron enzyme [Phycisphaerae bacterium]|nr:SUMF1/EgtB/PvdO family nonheme iron enzyme [Phycisphaerae bacterium]
MNTSKATGLVCVVIGLLAGAAGAVVIATVPVGNAGNIGELSGSGAGGYGPDRICGSVGYDYRIGTYEVTAGQYTEFLNKVGGFDTYGLYNPNMSDTRYGSGISRSGSGTVGDPHKYTVAWYYINRPVNYVSYWDSCRFANWLHNGQPTGAQGPGTTERGTYTLDGYNGQDGRTIRRNPGARWAVTSEDEWYKAAYYKGGSTNAGYFDYPTGSDTAPGRDMNDASGNNANYYTGSGPFPIDSGKYTTVVGEFQNSDSPYGTFDQGGNVWEWNEAVVYEEAGYTYRGLRGGAFDDNDDYLHASFRGYGYPSFEGYGVGFRVSEVPEPTSMAILALGGLGMLFRRRGQGR